ncbi:hypothetical protein GCM10023354_21540 [Garicola koreensis]|uniref:hypothetical protein n=1 Tax=Garicola koreensis TaxID=1262554 RepID=UPI0031E8C8DC
MRPTPDGDDLTPGPPAGFAGATALGFIAYVIFPTLAVVTAVFGVVLALRKNLASSPLFFGLLQLWLIGGIPVRTRRRRLLAQPSEEAAEDEPGSATL